MLDRLPITGIVRMEEVSLSGGVLAFTAGLTVLTGLLFGFMPALRAYAMGIASGMRDGARGTVSHRRLNSCARSSAVCTLARVADRRGIVTEEFSTARVSRSRLQS